VGVGSIKKARAKMLKERSVKIGLLIMDTC